MVYIFTALYCEAATFINENKLCKVDDFRKIQVFKNDEYILTITGTGAVQAAISLSIVCTTYKPNKNDWLINIGVCASNNSEQGDIYYCNKIYEQTTGRMYYPDILLKHSFIERTVNTVCKAVERKDIVDDNMYDMEAAGLYQAGTYYFELQNMAFIKIVSDNGIKQEEYITPEQVTKLIEKHYIEINNLMKQTKTLYYSDVKSYDDVFFEKITKDLVCSVNMYNQLKQYIIYCSLADIDYKEVINEMYHKGEMPCKNRKEGKQRFEDIKRKLIQ